MLRVLNELPTRGGYVTTERAAPVFFGKKRTRELAASANSLEIKGFRFFAVRKTGKSPLSVFRPLTRR